MCFTESLMFDLTCSTVATACLAMYCSVLDLYMIFIILINVISDPAVRKKARERSKKMVFANEVNI